MHAQHVVSFHLTNISTMHQEKTREQEERKRERENRNQRLRLIGKEKGIDEREKETLRKIGQI